MRNRVAPLRQGLNLTQEELGRQLGVSRQTIISIERGRFSPSLPLAFRLASTLNTPIDELFFPEETHSG